MARVNGFTGARKGLARARKQHAKGVERGLKKGGLFIQRESQKLVPIDTGALRNSAFTRAEGKGFDTVVTVGYTQDYAVYVHEDLEAKHAEGKTALYLERAVRENRREIQEIIINEAEKK